MRYLNKDESFHVLIQISLFLFLLSYTFLVYAEQDNAINHRKELERIIDAQNRISFEGQFRYSRPNYKIEPYIHQQIASDGQVKQWVRKLGTEEGFLNVNGNIRCVTSGYNDKFRINAVLQSIKLSNLDNLLKDYTISTGDDLNIAGRKAGELVLTSKSQDRYIYKLAFDKATYFPLAFIFLDNKNNVLERGGFSEFKPLSAKNIHANSLANCMEVSYAPHDANSKRLWMVDIIPHGFSLKWVNNDVKQQEEQQVYSDGLVAFSIFIEPFTNDALDGIKKHVGATVFVSRKLTDPKTNNTYLVAIVGEIPFTTAERVVSSCYIIS